MKTETAPFSAWLKREIEERLLTQQRFADRAGIHFWALRNWIGGRNVPSGVNLVRLSRALGVSREEVESHL